MKKTVLALGAVIGLATTSSAGVLYWTVNDSPASVTDVNNQTPSTQVSQDFNNWNTAKLAYYNPDKTGSDPNKSGSAVSFSPADSSSTTISQVGRAQATTSEFAFDASSGSYSSGVFYIELYNGDKLVGRSGEYLTYDSGNGTFSSSNRRDVFDGTLNFSDFKTWNGGSAYVAVPEPTSGVMLLLGAALLGLRRRRRA